MGAALAEWAPTVRDVANIVPDRTGDVAVHDGTFDTTTVPTAVQVAGLVRQIQSEIVAVVGAMPASLVVVPDGGTIGESVAGHVVALGAAYHVELDFYPDQQLTGQSRASMLREDYLRVLKSLAQAVNDADGGIDPGGTLAPTATFPVTEMIQWAQL